MKTIKIIKVAPGLYEANGKRIIAKCASVALKEYVNQTMAGGNVICEEIKKVKA